MLGNKESAEASTKTQYERRQISFSFDCLFD